MTAVVPVGIVEIAERLGVKRATVDRWLQRDLLPRPDWTVGGRSAWDWYAIRRWAIDTNRYQEDTMTDTFNEHERHLIAASGRTLASNERGATSGRLLRPESKPQPGDIRPCPVSRYLRALVLRSGTMGPFERGDGSGMEPGLHYYFEYAMVELTAEDPVNTVADLTTELNLPATARESVARFTGAFITPDRYAKTGRLAPRWAGEGMAATFTRDECETLIAEWNRTATAVGPDGAGAVSPVLDDPNDDPRAVAKRYWP